MILATSVGALLDTYYGAINASGGSLVGHQRLASVLNATTSNGSLIEYPIDYTYGDAYPANASTYSATAMRYVAGKGAMRYAVGAGGAVRIGSGIGPNLGLNVALAAPTLSGSGVYLNPLGIVNAASWAPFTRPSCRASSSRCSARAWRPVGFRRPRRFLTSTSWAAFR